MKWFIFVIMLIYIFRKSAYGGRVSVEIDPLKYGEEEFFQAGISKKILCKGSTRNQKLEWYNPSGNLVKHQSNGRVYVQETFASSYKGVVRGLVLHLDRTEVEDSGTWECRSGDAVQNISLCILDPPVFEDTETEISVDIGRSVTLGCQVRGEPVPKISWYRDEEIIADNNSSKYKVMTVYKSRSLEGLLTIISAEPEDHGIYQCVTEQDNPELEDCSTSNVINITLNVHSAPVFPNMKHSPIDYYYAALDDSVTLVCAADGYPTPTYRWFHEIGELYTEFAKNDIEFSTDGREANLTLIANDSTFGEKYRCRATNSYGNAHRRFSIIKLLRPTRPTVNNITNYTHNQIDLSVTWSTEEGADVFPIESFEIQFIEKSQISDTPKEFQWRKANTYDAIKEGVSYEENYISLMGLDPETDYWVRVRAKNHAGESLWSDAVLAGTDARPEAWNSPPLRAEFDGTYYGIFVGGGIVLLAFTCMLVLRKL